MIRVVKSGVDYEAYFHTEDSNEKKEIFAIEVI
jgi:hypothetical protein